MANIKLAFPQNRPCFQHDGGSGYIETGNRLILNSMDATYPAGGETVEYLAGHRRRVDIHFASALYPQNWVAAYTQSGCAPVEINRLNGLMEDLNEHIAARQELALNPFFLYFAVAYDFQLVWAADDAATLTRAAALQNALPQESMLLKLVFEDGKPQFSLLVGNVGVFKKGHILRLFPKPALNKEKCDSIDIGIVPVRTLEGQLTWTTGVKVNNYGNIAGPVLNQEYWGPILSAMDEALVENREMDLAEMVEFLNDAFLLVVADFSEMQPQLPAAASQAPATPARMSARVLRARAEAAAGAPPSPAEEAPTPAAPRASDKPDRLDRWSKIMTLACLALFLIYLLAILISKTFLTPVSVP
jgi:hypothetical protein